jgi:hypothetical protein
VIYSFELVCCVLPIENQMREPQRVGLGEGGALHSRPSLSAIAIPDIYVKQREVRRDDSGALFQSEKDANALAQKLGQLQPLIAIFPQESMGLHLLGQSNKFFAQVSEVIFVSMGFYCVLMLVVAIVPVVVGTIEEGSLTAELDQRCPAPPRPLGPWALSRLSPGPRI